MCFAVNITKFTVFDKRISFPRGDICLTMFGVGFSLVDLEFLRSLILLCHGSLKRTVLFFFYLLLLMLNSHALTESLHLGYSIFVVLAW